MPRSTMTTDRIQRALVVLQAPRARPWACERGSAVRARAAAGEELASMAISLASTAGGCVIWEDALPAGANGHRGTRAGEPS